MLLLVGALILKLLCHGMLYLQYQMAMRCSIRWMVVIYSVQGSLLTHDYMLTITGVTATNEISIFVVSFGGTNTLPSARSNVAVVPPGECLLWFAAILII